MHFGDLFQFGFGIGAGLAAIIMPIVGLVLGLDLYIDHRKRQARRSRRRVPSVVANTQELPVVPAEKIIDWGKDGQDTTS